MVTAEPVIEPVTASKPALTLVVPVNVLVPLRICVPVPLLIRAMLLGEVLPVVAGAMLPEYVNGPAVLAKLIVSVPAVALELTTEPFPDKPPTDEFATAAAAPPVLPRSQLELSWMVITPLLVTFDVKVLPPFTVIAPPAAPLKS